MADIEKLVDQLSALTVLEAADLAKALEEKWGVSAAAAVAVAGPAAAAAPAAEEQTEFDVILTGDGGNKIAVEFAKTNDKLEIVGGAMGDTFLDVNGVKALASLPSLDQLRSTIIGLVQAPATKIAQLSTAPAAKLARVFGAYADQEAA